MRSANDEIDLSKKTVNLRWIGKSEADSEIVAISGMLLTGRNWTVLRRQ
jgi:hypothetical protein